MIPAKTLRNQLLTRYGKLGTIRREAIDKIAQEKEATDLQVAFGQSILANRRTAD